MLRESVKKKPQKTPRATSQTLEASASMLNAGIHVGICLMFFSVANTALSQPSYLAYLRFR